MILTDSFSFVQQHAHRLLPNRILAEMCLHPSLLQKTKKNLQKKFRQPTVLPLPEAINEGGLQLALEEVNPNSRIVVESSVPTPTPAPAAASTGLSAGATAGIAVAAVATFLAAAGLLVARKKRLEKDDEYYAAGTQALADADQNARDARELKDGGEGDAAVAGGAMLGATQANYGKNKSKQAVQTSVVAFDTLEEDVKAGPRGDDESSNAGSSGWSSSAGVSSLNTGSADSLDFTGGQAVGATLAAIGAASAITSRQDSKQAYVSFYLFWIIQSDNMILTHLLLIFQRREWICTESTCCFSRRPRLCHRGWRLGCCWSYCRSPGSCLRFARHKFSVIAKWKSFPFFPQWPNRQLCGLVYRRCSSG